MQRKASGDLVLLAVCATSLAGYLGFSDALRQWLGAWDYYRALYRGLASLPDPLWIQFGKRIFLAVPWDPRQLGCLAGLLALSFLLTVLVWRLLRGRISFILTMALFVPACLVVPQMLLAFLFWPDGRGQVTIVNHMVILGSAAFGLGLLLLAGRRQKPCETQRQPGGGIGLWGIAFLVPTVIVFVTAFILAFSNSPGYDATAYHLPLAAGYGASSSILAKDSVPLNYPSNAELLQRWFVFPCNDRLASLPCFLEALLIPVVLFKLCRILGFERQPALIAACTAISFPLLPFLAVNPNSDLFAAVPLLLALFSLIALHRIGTADPIYLCCLGLALGLAAGSRFYLLPICAFMMLIATVILLRCEQSRFYSHDSDVNWPWFWRAILTVACCAVVGGGFWYIRSAMLHGNPFYPISILGLPGLPLNYINTVLGIIHDRPWLIAIYPWREFDYLIYDNGVGGVFTAFILPALVWWPANITANWKVEKDRFRFERVCLYLCICFCFLVFLSRPSSYTRQVSFGILLSFFLVAEMWRRIRGALFRIVLFLSFLLMSFSLEKALAGAILYGLATPAREGAERFSLPAIIDKLPSCRIFNAASAHLIYGCMGRDYRHQVLTVDREVNPRDVSDLRADYLLIYDRQKSLFERGLHLELVETAAGTNAGESLLLYRVLPP